MQANKPLKAVLFLLLAVSMLLGGCATLTVTPLQDVKSHEKKQPVNYGVRVQGDRLEEALSDPKESAIILSTGKLFDKIVLLPRDSRGMSTAEINTSFGSDYVLSSNLSDISVNGNLNPYFFPSLLMLVFKPYASIVTFEASASIESTLVEAKSGKVIFKKVTTSTVTDHFSPIEPEDKVRKLVERAINNTFITVFEDSWQSLAAVK